MRWLSANQTIPEVLLCGSHDLDLREFRSMISRQGYEVQTALNPVNAIRRARACSFQAVILLIESGNPDWLESIPVLNDLFPALPIVVVADQDCLETERKARQGRIFYYLLRPVDMPEVRAVLKEATAHAGLHQGGQTHETNQ